MPLDFSGYIPGIPNTGPGWSPPTVTQLLAYMRAELKKIQDQIGDLTPQQVQDISDRLTDLAGDVEDLAVIVSGHTGEISNIDGELLTIAGEITDINTALAGKAAGNTTGAAVRSASIPFGRCDDTSTATAFTATVPGITELKDGTSFWLQNGVITSASGFTININGLGAKKSYNNMTLATADTTLFNVNYTMLFVYSEALDGGNGGYYCYRGYDANTNTIGYQIRTNSYSMPMTSKVYRYRLLFTSADHQHFVPANNSTSTNATTARTPCQDPIDPFGPIVYYGTTAAVEANSRPAASSLWSQYTFTMGYSFIVGSAVNLTSWEPVYIKAAPQSDGSAIIDSTTPYVQALPTTNDGKIYILLGVAYSATAIEMLINHPVYYHDGTSLKIWTG